MNRRQNSAVVGPSDNVDPGQMHLNPLVLKMRLLATEGEKLSKSAKWGEENFAVSNALQTLR